jgi:hypothetical protein
MQAPIELNKAVAAVMAEIHRLKKTDENKHGQYKYVSVDDFKDLVRPLMAANGLSLSMTETDYSLETLQGRNGATVNARITYEFRLRHVSGESDEPERATIMLPHTGAQTAGAAKSYVIKEYLKGRFLVSTGDRDMIEGGADADAFKPQEYTGAPKKNITPHEDHHQSSGPQLLTREEARKLYKTLQAELVNLGSVREVSQWEKERILEIAKLGDWRSYMVKEIAKHLDYIEQATPREAAE